MRSYSEDGSLYTVFATVCMLPGSAGRPLASGSHDGEPRDDGSARQHGDLTEEATLAEGARDYPHD